MFSRKSFCVVSGASRGYGKTLAQMLAERLSSASVMVLTARNASLLESLKQQLSSKHPSLRFFCWQSDLANPCITQYSSYFQQLFKENSMKAEDFEQLVLVHNAGSIGDVTLRHTETTNRDQIDEYWRINITSVLLLNAALLPFFSAHQHCYLIDISSLCAIRPFMGYSLYCAGKAARKQLLNCLALENPCMRLLHWAPGPLRTDMTDGLDTLVIDSGMAAGMKDSNLLTCEESATKLMGVLRQDLYENRSHVDYYEVDLQGNLLKSASK